MSDMLLRKIFYNSWVPREMGEFLRGLLPEGLELVTLEADSDEERRERIAEAEVAVVAAKPLAKEVLAAGRSLRLAHHQGVGYQDTLDVGALKDRGIRLAITPVGTTESVAEHTVMLMLAVLRRLCYADSQLREGKWLINELRLQSRELRFCRVGIVGMGRIGQAVARRLKAFGVSGAYYDPVAALGEAEERELGFARKDFDELLRESDIVTLHLPCTEETRHCMDRRAVGLLREGAVLVNAARGGLVDEVALHEALRSGRLGGAALDCFEREPPDRKNPLLALPNVVLTPHIAAGTRDAIEEKWRFIYRNASGFLRDGTLENEVKL